MVKHPKRQNLTLFILLLFTFSFISCARAIKDTVDIETVFCPREDCHAVFLSTLKNATTIDCAFYDLDDPPLISLLKAKQAHLVMDEDNAISSDKEHLHIRKGKWLMHNKFCILDGKTVLTGSLNPTTNGFTRNNNNLLIINSRKITLLYEKEFQELWSSPSAQKSSPYSTISYDSSSLSIYFCPEDHCQDHLLKELETAKESIGIMVFSFTDKDIAEELIKKHQEGVRVQGVMEKQQLHMPYSIGPLLEKSGIILQPDANPALLHHKVFIIDNKTVITGSYNPTKNGDENNDENMLIIRDRKVASRFLEEFDFIRGVADGKT